MKITNLTNSPYPITLADGKKSMLPARGSLDGVQVSERDLALLKQCGYIRVEVNTEQLSDKKEAQKEQLEKTKKAKRKK